MFLSVLSFLEKELKLLLILLTFGVERGGGID